MPGRPVSVGVVLHSQGHLHVLFQQPVLVIGVPLRLMQRDKRRLQLQCAAKWWQRFGKHDWWYQLTIPSEQWKRKWKRKWKRFW